MFTIYKRLRLEGVSSKVIISFENSISKVVSKLIGSFRDRTTQTKAIRGGECAPKHKNCVLKLLVRQQLSYYAIWKPENSKNQRVSMLLVSESRRIWKHLVVTHEERNTHAQDTLLKKQSDIDTQDTTNMIQHSCSTSTVISHLQLNLSR